MTLRWGARRGGSCRPAAVERGISRVTIIDRLRVGAEIRLTSGRLGVE